MKKLIVFVLLFVSLFVVACGDKSVDVEEEVSETEVAEPVEAEESIEVDETLLNVEITLPASYFEDETPEEIESSAKEEGIKEVIANDDGSYTYVMSKKKHQEMMDSIAEEYAVEFADPSVNYPSVKSIEYNDDFSKFTITVDKEAYEDSWDLFVTMEAGMSGMMYQTFDSVSEDDIEVVINVVDSITNEVFNTTVYPDALDEME